MKIKCDWYKPANFPGFPGSLQTSSNPVSRWEHQIYSPWETPTVAFSKIFSLFRYFGDVKKENKTRSGFSALIWADLDQKT